MKYLLLLILSGCTTMTTEEILKHKAIMCVYSGLHDSGCSKGYTKSGKRCILPKYLTEEQRNEPERETCNS